MTANEVVPEIDQEQTQEDPDQCCICLGTVDKSKEYGKVDLEAERNAVYHIVCLNQWFKGNKKRSFQVDTVVESYGVYVQEERTQTVILLDLPEPPPPVMVIDRENNREVPLRDIISGDYYVHRNPYLNRTSQNHQNNDNSGTCAFVLCVMLLILFIILLFIGSGGK
jgi:hypothetical protein